MKLDMIGIITKDMEKSIEFYALLGFIANGATTEEYVELAHEGIRISLNTSKMIAGIYGYEPQTIGDKIELAFLCDSVADVDEIVMLAMRLLKNHGMLFGVNAMQLLKILTEISSVYLRIFRQNSERKRIEIKKQL